MKKLAFLAVLLLGFSAFSQENRSAEMTMPEYPALSIIGSQTSEITKPGDYSALLASVVSPMVSNNGTIPANLALEFNPYYFKAERRTLDEYANRDIWSSIKRTSKFSIASNNVLGSDSILYSRVGLGYRAFLYDGKLSPDLYTKDIIKAKLISSFRKLTKEIEAKESADISFEINETIAINRLIQAQINRDSKFGEDVYTILIESESNTEKVTHLNAIREGLAQSESS